VDVANAVSMQALRLASGSPAALLDWNNNYSDDDDRCILFHCGPVPASLMTDRGRVTDHSILANSVGLGCAFGCHQGRIAPSEITFSGLLTEAGRLRLYLGEGRITADPIPPEFFGCAGVAEIMHLQDVLLHIGRYGYRHHVSITPGTVQAPLQEALESYLGYEVTLPQMER
jgi:L-fucose isomerase-like protein